MRDKASIGPLGLVQACRLVEHIRLGKVRCLEGWEVAEPEIIKQPANCYAVHITTPGECALEGWILFATETGYHIQLVPPEGAERTLKQEAP